MEDNSKLLRERAKEELRRGKKIETSLYETDLKVLVEELSIYQIELEHQNQELIHSQDEIQQSLTGKTNPCLTIFLMYLMNRAITQSLNIKKLCLRYVKKSGQEGRHR